MKFEVNRRRWLAQASAGAVALTAAGRTRAQTFPSHPVRLVFPYTAGSTGDTILRLIAQHASEPLGARMFVDNRPGAGGVLGLNELIRAEANGYTICQLPIGAYRFPHMQKTAFDPMTDFSYIIRVAGFLFGLVVRNDSPIRSIDDLVKWAKDNPGNFAYASPGVGTTGHLAVEDLAGRAGIRLNHVPFKGDPDALQALMGGHVMAHSASATAIPLIESGQARFLATYGQARAKRLPDVPTLKELGYDVVHDAPWGIGAPRDVPAPIVARLHDALKRSIDSTEVKTALDKYDMPLLYLDSAAYARYARDTFASERVLIERLGLLAK